MPILPQTHPLKKVEDRVKNRQMSRRELSERVKNHAEEGQFGMKEEDPHVVQLDPRHHGPRGSRRKRGSQGE